MNENMSFEEAMKKLEEKASLIKREDITLEEALNAYDEGIKLYKVCTEILDNAKQRITVMEGN